MLKIIGLKFIIGMCVGFIIDLIFRKKHTPKENLKETEDHIHHMCEHCDCEHKGILRPALKHTIEVFIFILIFAFILNTAIYPIIASLIGLIPNCASSVLLTELYLSGNISFASIIAGLSSGSGLGLVILFKENKNVKENLKILGIVYAIGVSIGLIIELISII